MVSSLEKPFFVLILFLASEALLPLLLLGPSLSNVPYADTSATLQAIWTGIYLIAGVLIIARWREVRECLAGQKWLVFLLGLAIASVLWSAAPAVTARRAIALVGTTMVGALVAVRFGLEGTLRLTAQALLAAAVLSVLFVVAIPHLGIATGVHEGAWQGVFVQKNRLGRMMALASLAFFLLGRADARAWGWRIALALALLLLYKSQSASAVVISVITAAAYVLLRILRIDYRLLAAASIVLGLITIGAGYWVSQNFEAVASAVGRDATLTGRTLLWLVLIAEISNRPWLGYGYGAFWSARSGSVWQMLTWKPGHAHNGYLDALLDLGVIGLGVAMLGLASVFLRELRGLRSSRSPVDAWAVLFMVLYFIYNIVESALLTRNNLFWMLCVAVAVSSRASPKAPESEREVRQAAPAHGEEPWAMPSCMPAAREPRGGEE